MSRDLDKFKIIIDTDIEDYRTIIDHEWIRQTATMVEGTKLDGPLFELCMNWRAAANSAAFPWMMMASLSGFYNNANKRPSFIPLFVDAMADQLPRFMGDLLSPQQHTALRTAIRHTARNVESNSRKDIDPDMTASKLWAQFQDPELWELHVGVWGAQRLCFSQLYHAYEAFFQEILAVMENDPEYRFRNFKGLCDCTKKHFGQDIADKCLGGELMEIFRLIRNALAHNSGRETPELKAKGHQVEVVNDVLQIRASQNHKLLHSLQKRVSIITEAAVKLPGFHLPA